jgi:hypothetical protein
MALYKPVVQDDGVTTNYHRILYTMSHINSHISIAVVSYIDRIARDTETGDNQPYRKYVTYETAYKENMTIEDAYSYLKSLSQFAGADDI